MNIKMRLNIPVKNISTEWQIIIFLAALKLIIHFLTFSNFELHRDAYLYYAQSQHLAWGFFSVPPETAFITRIATWIFGNTVFGMRFFPALIGAVNIVIIGMATKGLGGRGIAVGLACISYLLSPAYLHTNFLLQPICFNHFYWLLTGYLVLRMIKRDDPAMWIWIGIVFGFGFLNKYSIVFLYAALAISILLSPYRKYFLSKYFIISAALGILIILPNLLWQYKFNWPVVSHLSELYETQLIHVKLSGFLLDQILMNAHAIILWTGALLILLFYTPEKQYRLFGYTFIFVIVILIFGRGKSYYSLGIYPILFVFGAYFTEKYIKKYLVLIFSSVVILMVISLYISLSFDGVPFTTFEKATKKNAYIWEDGVYHDLPQDIADMTGWKEIGQKVRETYLSLKPKDRENCDIYCYHYGQAGAVMFYGKDVNIPQPISFNGSFQFWAPDSLVKKYMIWVHPGIDEDNPDILLPKLFGKSDLKAVIENKYFRENGTRIYLCESPTETFKNYYLERLNRLKIRRREL